MPATDDTKAAVEFQTFGTELEVQALPLGNNQVRLEINTRVSEVDEGHAIEMNGVRIPGLKVRHCNATVELPFGQTAVLTGLLSSVAQQTEGNIYQAARTQGLETANWHTKLDALLYVFNGLVMHNAGDTYTFGCNSERAVVHDGDARARDAMRPW